MSDIPTFDFDKENVPSFDFDKEDEAKKTLATVDPESDHKLSIANTFSRVINPQWVYHNVDALSKSIYGVEVKAKDFVQRIGNTFKEEKIREEIGRYGQRQFAEETDDNAKHIADLKKQLPPPEETLSKVPKAILQSLQNLGYMGVSGAGFLATDMAAFLSGEMGTRALGRKPLTNIEPAMEAEAERFSGNFIGQVYQSMRDEGIDPTIARSVSGGLGAFQAAMFGLPISRLPGVRQLEQSAINEAIQRAVLGGGIDRLLLAKERNWQRRE